MIIRKVYCHKTSFLHFTLAAVACTNLRFLGLNSKYKKDVRFRMQEDEQLYLPRFSWGMQWGNDKLHKYR